jgi:hypothetical protein
MPEPTATDNRTLLRKTLITVAVMVGSCVVVVGTLTLFASAIAGHAIESPQVSETGSPTPSNAAVAPGFKPMPGNTTATQRK